MKLRSVLSSCIVVIAMCSMSTVGATDLLNKAFEPSFQQDAVVDFGSNKQAVGAYILGGGVQITLGEGHCNFEGGKTIHTFDSQSDCTNVGGTDRRTGDCYVDAIGNDGSTQPTLDSSIEGTFSCALAGGEWVEREFPSCRINGVNYTALDGKDSCKAAGGSWQILEYQESFLLRLVKLLLRLLLIGALIGALVGAIKFVFALAKKETWTTIAKSFGLLAGGIILALGAVVIINLLRSIAESSITDTPEALAPGVTSNEAAIDDGNNDPPNEPPSLSCESILTSTVYNFGSSAERESTYETCTMVCDTTGAASFETTTKDNIKLLVPCN